MANFLYIVMPDCEGNITTASSNDIYVRDLPDKAVLASLAKEAKNIVSLMRAEEDVQFYYSRDAIEVLKSYARNFSEYPYQIELCLIAEALVAMGGVDYKDSPMYTETADFSLNIFYLRGEIVSTAGNHLVCRDDAVCNVALVNADALKMRSGDIHFTTSLNHTVSPIIRCLKFKAGEIAKYMSDFRIPMREFFPSDKHGVNMPEDADLGGASPLMCSAEEARVFLQHGFSDREKRVWSYDKSRNKFITFQKQDNNVWHGYHLIKHKDVDREEMPNWLVPILKEIAP